MGRHGAAGGHRRSLRVPVPLVLAIVLLLVAVGLGIWWWVLRSATDPIDAHPVDGYAVVVSSPPCPGSAGTVVRVEDVQPQATATMDACGYEPGKRLAIQYLDGHPTQLRLAGTTTAGSPGAGRWLPLGILLAGVLAVAALLVLLVERRISRHAGPARPRAAADSSTETAGPQSAVVVDPSAVVVDPPDGAARATSPGAGSASPPNRDPLLDTDRIAVVTMDPAPGGSPWAASAEPDSDGGRLAPAADLSADAAPAGTTALGGSAQAPSDPPAEPGDEEPQDVFSRHEHHNHDR